MHYNFNLQSTANMSDTVVHKSASILSARKQGLSAARVSLKAASSILKTMSSLRQSRAESGQILSGSRTPESIHKSVSIVVTDKSASSFQTGAPKPTQTSLSGVELDARSSTAEEDGGVELRTKTIYIDEFGGRMPMGLKMRPTKFMRKYPELFRSDVSVHPSYTGLLNYPYNVVCRQRFHKNKLKMNRQLNREIQNITMTQSLALDGVRIDRIFTVGFPPSAVKVPDFATANERLRLDRMLVER
ncbi:uncharacterized protein LOC124411198 [Diprion similis]|uniref:uncharacterized protein LOC124411198 n=1 Tax=Diprion similis TaxID=362088 RepID=UPI001EF8B3B9|nr:uncharacterized protein LOC124411198 [Diprion similis]